jgi:hypothetical protein
MAIVNASLAAYVRPHHLIFRGSRLGPLYPSLFLIREISSHLLSTTLGCNAKSESESDMSWACCRRPPIERPYLCQDRQV